MKKIFLAATFIIACSLIGIGQNVEKALRNGKWYANAELGSNKITLSKNAATANVLDVELKSEVAMSCGQTAKADFIDAEGRQVKAGTYVVDNAYAYKINGNSLWIGFQPKEWNYNVTAQKNGDLILELITPTPKNTK